MCLHTAIPSLSAGKTKSSSTGRTKENRAATPLFVRTLFWLVKCFFHLLSGIIHRIIIGSCAFSTTIHSSLSLETNLLLPVLAGYIAMAIADRPALAVGFVGGMIADKGKSGFLGALVAGFVAGYLIIGFKKIMRQAS